MGNAAVRQRQGFLNSGIKLDNGDQIYFFANYANIQTNESFNYRLPETVTDSTGTTFGNHPAFNNIYLEPAAPPPTPVARPADTSMTATPSISVRSIRRVSRRASSA